MDYGNIICDTCNSQIPSGNIIYKAYDGNFCSKSCENVKHYTILNLDRYEQNPYLWQLYKLNHNEYIKSAKKPELKKSKSCSVITITSPLIISETNLEVNPPNNYVKLSYKVIGVITGVFSIYGFGKYRFDQHTFPIIL